MATCFTSQPVLFLLVGNQDLWKCFDLFVPMSKCPFLPPWSVVRSQVCSGVFTFVWNLNSAQMEVTGQVTKQVYGLRHEQGCGMITLI
ncbi:unnamed protein product [Lathyrus sativus]|nr:unnamed protein product [Lathyrus sativus]CAK8067710.1 unnamed protein product [Lathyrus sativus]